MVAIIAASTSGVTIAKMRLDLGIRGYLAMD
jgi:hypothetical protein